VFYDDFCTPGKYRACESLFYHPNPIWKSGSHSVPCHISVSQGLRYAVVVIPVIVCKMLIIYFNSVANEKNFNDSQMDKNDNKNFKPGMGVKLRMKA